MARQGLQKVYADFRKGIVDIASSLQQPEGTVKDLVNFDIKLDGSLVKRSGLQESGDRLEYYYQTSPQAFLWEKVDGDVDKTFLVIRSSFSLFFYDVSHGNVDLSTDYLVDTVTMHSKFPKAEDKYDFTPALGKLFFANPRIGVGYIEYISSSNSLRAKTFDLKIRDTSVWEGNNDSATGLVWSYGGSCEPQRYYNLKNAGWPDNVTNVTKSRDTFKTVQDANVDPIYEYKRRLGRWPKISESFYISRSGGGSSANELEAFNAYNFEIDVAGSSIPPVGRRIVPAYAWTRHALGVSETYSLTEAPSKLTFYSGRIWYAGDYDYDVVAQGTTPSEYSSKGNIYFSQDIRANLNNAEKCYQENDPTSEDLNQLLATDGGVLTIKDLGSVKGLLALSSALFVMSDQGIWRISGKDFNSFSADSYSIDKISNIKVTSENSYVVANSSIYVFAEEGLHMISIEGDIGSVNMADISSGLIKNYVQNLPEKSIRSIKVSYNKKRNIISCFIVDPLDSTGWVNYETGHNVVLNFNIDLGCFYKYRVDLPTADILDFVDGIYTKVVTTNEPVVDSSGEVYVNSSGEDYYIPRVSGYEDNDITLILLLRDYITGALVPCKFTDNIYYKDFGSEFLAECDIGFDSAQDLLNDSKQAPYIASFLGKPAQEVAFVYDYPDVTEEDLVNAGVLDYVNMFIDPSDSKTMRRSGYANASERGTLDGDGILYVLDKSRNLSLGEELVTEIYSGAMENTDSAGIENRWLFDGNAPAPLTDPGVTTNFIPIEVDKTYVFKVEVIGSSDKRIWIEEYSEDFGVYSRHKMSSTTDFAHLAEDYVIFNYPLASQVRFSCRGSSMSVKEVEGAHIGTGYNSDAFDFGVRDNYDYLTLGIDSDNRYYLEGQRGLYRQVTLSVDRSDIPNDHKYSSSDDFALITSLQLQNFPVEDGGSTTPFNRMQMAWNNTGYAQFYWGARIFELKEDNTVISRGHKGYDYGSYEVPDRNSKFLDGYYNIGSEGRYEGYLNGAKVSESTQDSNMLSGFLNLIGLGPQEINYYTRTPRIYSWVVFSLDMSEGQKKLLYNYLAGKDGITLPEEKFGIPTYKPLPEASCKMTYRWDWGTSYSKDQELYRYTRLFVPEDAGTNYPYPKEIIKNKSRIRGRGTSLNIKLEAEAGKACEIQGLAIMYTG